MSARAWAEGAVGGRSEGLGVREPSETHRTPNPDPAPSALPGVPRPEGDPGSGQRRRAPRPCAVTSGGSRGGTWARVS